MHGPLRQLLTAPDRLDDAVARLEPHKGRGAMALELVEEGNRVKGQLEKRLEFRRPHPVVPRLVLLDFVGTAGVGAIGIPSDSDACHPCGDSGTLWDYP